MNASSSKVLVSEFRSKDEARSAALQLRSGGIDLADVEVHGRDWLNHTDPEGGWTLAGSIVLGMKVGGGMGVFGGLLISFLHACQVAPQPLLPVMAPYFLTMFCLGLFMGGFVGTLYGLVASGAETPDWIGEVYELALAEGNFLVLVSGDEQLTAQARSSLLESRPVTQLLCSAH